MADSPSINISIRFQGGIAASNRLDMYDGAASLFGLSKAFLISSHFLINEKIVFQAPAASGVRCFLLTSRPGSWDQAIQIVIDNKEFLLGVGAATAKDILKDFTKVVLTHGVGRPVKAATSYVRDLLNRKKSEFEVLTEATGGSLRDAHRTIEPDGTTSVRLRSDGERLVTLNAETWRYVTDFVREDRTREVVGNISSYNVNSRRGRIYDSDLGRTVPFVLDKGISNRARIATTWSLDRRNNGVDGDVIATVTRELTINREVRRYIVHNVRHA